MKEGGFLWYKESKMQDVNREGISRRRGHKKSPRRRRNILGTARKDPVDFASYVLDAKEQNVIL